MAEDTAWREEDGTAGATPADVRLGTCHPTPAIEQHGIIGDLRTAALVDMWGTVGFLCWPRFDSPSVFACLLDPEGGRFDLAADLAEPVRLKQIYLPDTNVLITRFLSEQAVVEVTDLMPVDGAQRLIRTARCIRGTARMRLRCAPRFDYARMGHAVEPCEGGVRFRPEGDAPALRLLSTVPLEVEERDAVATFELAEGEEATVLLDAPEDGEETLPCGLAGYGAQCFADTVGYWRRWLGRSSYRGRARGIVQRSALALKLLTSAEHGSIVAAPTFGLPEALGGERNWDYRYTWVRDAAFTLYAFVRLGFTEEARAFMHWAQTRMEEGDADGSLQIMYGLDGRPELAEEELGHLRGYAGSAPVRVGNAAWDQLQLDSYGALMDAVYLSHKHAEPISHRGWTAVTRTVDWVCANWEREDEGIWEFRGGRRHFLSSRLMCWVAVDRAVRMARKSSLPGPVERWRGVRDEIHRSIHADFWDEEQGAFTQSKGEPALDASCLLMPLTKFISPTDPRWLSTLDRVGEVLAKGELVQRYDVTASQEIDGLEGDEGSFTVCSFWYAECLARAGRLDEARLTFDKLLSYANHLGLYAEELGPAGDHLGNFPQALTHLALISAAVAIDREEG